MSAAAWLGAPTPAAEESPTINTLMGDPCQHNRFAAPAAQAIAARPAAL